jgi:hypothetical protein
MIVDRHPSLTDAAAASATFDDSKTYRYRLSRRWGNEPAATFIMLNPSTADAFQDDPTVRRCISFAKREGCGGLVVLNLFALRATNPAELLTHEDPVGPWNDAAFGGIERAGPVVAAWGVPPIRGRDIIVAVELERQGLDVQCLGRTQGGFPRHPLRLAAATPLQPWRLP